MQTLFAIPEPVYTPQVIQIISKHRCRTCEYCYKHNWGEMHYCELQLDPRTAYGHKKIKSNSFGCEKHSRN